MSMKSLVGKKVTKTVKFMEEDITITRLSVKEVLEVQEIVKKSQKSKSSDSQVSLLRDVIRVAVDEAKELSDDDFDSFPIGELTELTEAILVYSGLQDASSGN